jgi:hypothetical protein
LGKVAGHTWAKLWERTTREKERERQHLPFELAQADRLLQFIGEMFYGKTSSKSQKYVYLFGNKKADGNGGMKPLLGGKGANLAEMTRIGLPVPPGFTITTEVCTYYYAHKRNLSRRKLWAQVKAGVANTEKILGKKIWRHGETAAGRRPLRRPRFHARHDGHHFEPRPQRPNRAGAWKRSATIPASPGIATAASSKCTATSSWACKKAPQRRPRTF